jgi:hypothetical protein
MMGGLMNGEVEKIWTEAFVACAWRKLRKIMYNLSQDRQCFI